MPYDELFFATMHEAAYRSAKIVLEKLWADCTPDSVIDVGCGLGSWLLAAQDLGVPDIFGLDNWAPIDQLVIPREKFARQDLSLPFCLEREFEVAMCLEVAEHVPAGCSDGLVETLCKLAPKVLFSAAIPGQGGEGHVNEQWPQYWVNKFHKQGYECTDLKEARFMGNLWADQNVSWWYRQNLLLFYKIEKPYLRQARSVVHPELWKKVIAELEARK